jgi:hypothetical protein
MVVGSNFKMIQIGKKEQLTKRQQNKLRKSIELTKSKYEYY